MSEIITDRMLVLARQLNRGLSGTLDGCYAKVSPDLRHLRVEKSGWYGFAMQDEFKEADDESIVKDLEDDFKRYRSRNSQ